MKSAPTILGPKGSPMVELGGERAWRTFHKGDVIASLQWIDVKATDPSFEEDGPVPCMCLFSAFRRMDTGSYVIPQRNAFQYALSSGAGIPDSFLMAVSGAVQQLGFDLNDKAARHRVFDLVLEAMPDLINMPSEQPEALAIARRVQGIEVTVRAGDRVIHSELH